MCWSNSDPGFVYLMAWGSLYKIGISRKVEKRLREIGYEYPGVQLVHTVAVDVMRALEDELHARYADKRRQGEWFELSSQDVAEITAL